MAEEKNEKDARLADIVVDMDGFEYAPHEEQPSTPTGGSDI